MSDRKPWMTDDQWYCAEFFADIVGGFHHVTGKFAEWGAGLRVSDYSNYWSTFDFDRLSRLVFLAHDRCVRVEIVQSGLHRIGLLLHRRHTREGSTSVRHPTLDQAITVHRKLWQAPPNPESV
jgi:hypothetical protein